MKKAWKIIAAVIGAGLYVLAYFLIENHTVMSGMFLIAVTLLAGAAFASCYLVSLYTDMGMFEPVIILLIALPIIIIGGSKSKAVEFVIGVVTMNGNLYGDNMSSIVYDADRLFVVICFSLVVFLTLLIVLCIVILAVVFTFCTFCGIFAKKCTGVLVKIERPEGKLAKFAYYRVDGKVYQCAVAGPSKKLVIGNEYNVRLNSFQQKVYDKSFFTICVSAVLVWFILLAGLLLSRMMMNAYFEVRQWHITD